MSFFGKIFAQNYENAKRKNNNNKTRIPSSPLLTQSHRVNRPLCAELQIDNIKHAYSCVGRSTTCWADFCSLAAEEL